MSSKQSAVEVTLRIPGQWSGLQEVAEHLPADYRLAERCLKTPEGISLELCVMPADRQFPQVFRTACRRPVAKKELEIVDHFKLNLCLTGPGGSLEAARSLVTAGGAIVRAGAGGVFIDNSGLAHGAGHWLEIADDGGSDALSFAFVSIVRGRLDVWTMGMQVLGLPDLSMPRADAEADQEVLIDTLRYLATGLKPIGDGHIIADENGPRYHVRAATDDRFPLTSPMHNPFGRLKLISYHALAEQN